MPAIPATPTLMRRLGPEYKDETEYDDDTLQAWLDDAEEELGDGERFGDSYQRVHAYAALALLTDAEGGRTDRLRGNQGVGMVGALVSIQAGNNKTFRTDNPFRDLDPALVAKWGTSRFSLKVIGYLNSTEGSSSTPYLIEV